MLKNTISMSIHNRIFESHNYYSPLRLQARMQTPRLDWLVLMLRDTMMNDN